MFTADQSSLAIVAYLALFVAVAFGFVFVNLLVGRLVRSNAPSREKLEIYECGEPPVGSSFVQFDLRFYVVALLFIIFDVEVAFFFPWAVVFGKANHLARAEQTQVVKVEEPPEEPWLQLKPESSALHRELGVKKPAPPVQVPQTLGAEFQKRQAADAELSDDTMSRIESAEASSFVIARGAKQLAWVTVVDILVFFGVLLVGFAYVWKRGDLEWVRAVSQRGAADA